MRTADVSRKTAETDIQLSLNLDGSGKSELDTGCGFLDHMLTLFARHGRFDLAVTCRGDTYVDDHHTVEDIGICLGDAFARALGDKRGVKRYGSMALPMDRGPDPHRRGPERPGTALLRAGYPHGKGGDL